MSEGLASIDPHAVVHPSAKLGVGCLVGAFCVVEQDCVVGDGCVLEPFSRICQKTVVGAGSRIGQGASVGGLAQVRGLLEGGGCKLGEGVRVGEYATIHASSTADGWTKVEEGAMVLAYAHVAHDCRVGARSVLANGVQLGGHVEIGLDSFLGGGAHVHQFVKVGDLAFVAGCLRLDRDLAPWSRALGEPPRWAGCNRVALARTPGAPDRAEVEDCLRTVFRRGLLVDDAVRRLIEVGSSTANALAIFIQGARRGLLRPE
ncbi:MAG: hypothetical protein IPK50_23000 [Fibrobacterota bacterium]|nr:MAG: hypothetical protein IPK50_23000 [Fibrobacterota bacterium]